MYLQLDDLAVEVTRHDPWTEQLEAAHLGFDEASFWYAANADRTGPPNVAVTSDAYSFVPPKRHKLARDDRMVRPTWVPSAGNGYALCSLYPTVPMGRPSLPGCSGRWS